MPIHTVFLDAGGVLVKPEFNLVLPQAGVALHDASAAAPAELHTSHQTFHLWERVPDEVRASLAALRASVFASWWVT